MSDLLQNHLTGRRSRQAPDDEEDIEFGIRRSRRRTSYYYRASSSVSPVDIMMRELFFSQCEDFLSQSLIIGQVIALSLIIYNALKRNQSSLLRNNFTMQSLERMVERLFTLLEWTRYYAELSLLYAANLTVYAR